MGGQRIAGNALPVLFNMPYNDPRDEVYIPDTHPPWPYIAYESGSVNTVWMMGDLYVPERCFGTEASTSADVMVNPANPHEFVYCAWHFADSTQRNVYLFDMRSNTKTLVKTVVSAEGQHPFACWNPEGTKFVYSKNSGAPLAGTKVDQIRVMDRDGTNDTLLYEYTPPPYEFGYGLTVPSWSPSGDYIAFGKGLGLSTQHQVCVMNADGSGVIVVSTSSSPGSPGHMWNGPYQNLAWQHGADVLGWGEMEAEMGGGVRWRMVNADGSGFAELGFTAHSEVLPQVKDTGSSRFCWLPDNSGMLQFRSTGSTDPRWRLGMVAADGSGFSWIGSHYTYGTLTGNPFGTDIRPFVFGSGDIEYRIYWTPSSASTAFLSMDVVSCLPDGTDLRTDDDGTGPPAHGFHAIDTLAQ